MSSSEELSKTLEDSLRKLETKTSNIERLAIEVKENEKRLSDIANSTISYISQLKSQCNAKIISGTSLADNIMKQMDKILISLKRDPKKKSIDETLEQLQGILQTNKSSTQESSTQESSTQGSSTQESSTQESGFFSDPLGNISKMISGDSNVPKPASPPASLTSTLTDSSKFQKGGYRYSTPKKNIKTKKHILKKSKARGRGRGRNSNKKSLSNNRRIKSYFRKTRKKHSK